MKLQFLSVSRSLPMICPTGMALIRTACTITDQIPSGVAVRWSGRLTCVISITVNTSALSRHPPAVHMAAVYPRSQAAEAGKDT